MNQLEALKDKAQEFDNIIKSIKEYSKGQTLTQDISDSLTHWRGLLLETLSEIKELEPTFNEALYESAK